MTNPDALAYDGWVLLGLGVPEHQLTLAAAFPTNDRIGS